MSTRSIIARPAEGPEGSWEGRYHHWDGYPSGVGATLYQLAQPDGPFGGNLFSMLDMLLDQHPAGWSTINADWSQTIGFRELRPLREVQDPANGPQCYCHGDRHEKGFLRSSALPEPYEEYLYIINPLNHMMEVFDTHGALPLLLAAVDLDGSEPNWETMEK